MRPAADGFLENSLNGVPKVQVGRRISQAKGQKDGLPSGNRSPVLFMFETDAAYRQHPFSVPLFGRKEHTWQYLISSPAI